MFGKWLMRNGEVAIVSAFDERNKRWLGKIDKGGIELVWKENRDHVFKSDYDLVEFIRNETNYQLHKELSKK